MQPGSHLGGHDGAGVQVAMQQRLLPLAESGLPAAPKSKSRTSRYIALTTLESMHIAHDNLGCDVQPMMLIEMT